MNSNFPEDEGSGPVDPVHALLMGEEGEEGSGGAFRRTGLSSLSGGGARAELRAQLPLATTDDYVSMLDFLEMFIAVPLHVMVRFGRWYDILAEPLPAVAGTDDNRFSATLAVQRYARAVALAALGRVGEAQAEAEAFELAKASVPESRKHLIYNTYGDVLGVAQSMLQGEIACESAAACLSLLSLRLPKARAAQTARAMSARPSGCCGGRSLATPRSATRSRVSKPA